MELLIDKCLMYRSFLFLLEAKTYKLDALLVFQVHALVVGFELQFFHEKIRGIDIIIVVDELYICSFR